MSKARTKAEIILMALITEEDRIKSIIAMPEQEPKDRAAKEYFIEKLMEIRPIRFEYENIVKQENTLTNTN